MTLNLEAWQKRVLLVLGLLAVAGLFALAFTAGRVAAAPQHPGNNSADAGFARDMQVHHAQAVEMSRIVREQTDDVVIRAIAYDIAMTQQHQIGQMFAWLEEWGLPQSSDSERMTWMSGSGHGHMNDDGGSMLTPEGLMPGMATPEQLQALSEATGDDAERIYLELMIEHHKAGVEMAQAGVELAQEPEVRELAEKMAAGQATEITAMEDLLAEL
ncbi:uncharacterized protein (DUF305 family) [Arthrobacter pigmenti]|uniref:Uncharacterized protein (DUF305 family) n=1 Tax=Arthrobacter pigmenti TaxID=271432 RepID=A0A846RV96_9MICC|nr:DUF305 domain-containing protein [Arthrobacter pigmenti]NJC24087.1 uncharacterized protein (DUF305 family) [Arthrobacter pigmenti]